jgi:predicted nucleic acid-binding protein
MIADPDDRKFAALAAAANAPLVTNDNLVLVQRDRIGIDIVTPRDFLARRREQGP